MAFISLFPPVTVGLEEKDRSVSRDRRMGRSPRFLKEKILRNASRIILIIHPGGLSMRNQGLRLILSSN